MDTQPQIKIALPKGRALAETAALLHRAEWGISGYREGGRLYRLKSRRFPNLLARVFHEKDIPIQVAVGNYDLGICGRDWVEELLAKYSSSALIKVENLGYGKGSLYLTSSQYGKLSTAKRVRAEPALIRIASEYPNLAESLALNLRLKRFSVFPLWGAAEVYPPESADLVLVPARTEAELLTYRLTPLTKVLDFSTYLIANKYSWETKDMGSMLAAIYDSLAVSEQPPPAGAVSTPEITGQYAIKETDENTVRLALPDGHQQLPTRQLLDRAGVEVNDYPSASDNRRPACNLANTTIKVIRPQDMPLQVANGNFDLAITGRDWLMEHLFRFPSSPVREILDLKLGRVRIVAVVSQDLAVNDVQNLRQVIAESSVPLRVASEYVNIADKYARDNHLGAYRVVPTWGASEAFLPEDADLLIENTQTGQTLARHNLKIIDTLFESSACLIGNTSEATNPSQRERIDSITQMLRNAVRNA